VKPALPGLRGFHDLVSLPPRLGVAPGFRREAPTEIEARDKFERAIE
jgi:hypothetical protein